MQTSPPEETTAAFLKRFAAEQAMAEAQARATIGMLQRRFGDMPHGLQIAILSIAQDQLDGLFDTIPDFRSMADAQAWVAATNPRWGVGDSAAR